MRGWVYVISNKAMEGLIKVGHSTKDPELRAQELAHTGSPHPYRVEYEILIEEPYRVEQTVHKVLSKFHEGKEWFRCTPEQAVAAIKQVAGDKQILENFKCANRKKAEELRCKEEETHLEKEAKEAQEKQKTLIKEKEQQIINEHYHDIRRYSFDEGPFAAQYLASAYQRRGEDFLYNCLYEMAIEDFNKRIQLDPNHSNAYICRGLAYYNKGQYDKAIEDFDKAITLNPKSVKAYCNRGDAYAKKGLYDRAIEDFNKTIAMDPNHEMGLNNRGLAYHNKGQYDKAIEDYNVVIALDPDDADAYISRGRANEMLGNKSMAISDYKKACDLGLQEGCEILQKVLRQ